MGYDVNNSKRIYNLMVLKGKCLKYNNDHIHDACEKFDLPSNFSASSFYSSMSDAIDNLLFFFVNDEVSASLDNRGPLGDILACSLEEHASENDGKYLEHSIPDIQELFKNRTDFIIGSNFLDFTVSSFSVFEKWLCNIYDELRIRKPSKNKKVKELKKLISKYNSIDENNAQERDNLITKLMGSCSSYVSSSEKIDFALSLLTNSYERDIDQDREIIKMYRSKRNTIHNLGVHNHKSLKALNVQGVDVQLEQGRPSFTEDYNSNIYMCDEIVEIYQSMIRNLKPCNLDNFIEWESI